MTNFLWAFLLLRNLRKKKNSFQFVFLILNPCVWCACWLQRRSGIPQPSWCLETILPCARCLSLKWISCFSASGSLDLMKRSPDDSLYTLGTNPNQGINNFFTHKGPSLIYMKPNEICMMNGAGAEVQQKSVFDAFHDTSRWYSLVSIHPSLVWVRLKL